MHMPIGCQREVYLCSCARAHIRWLCNPDDIGSVIATTLMMPEYVVLCEDIDANTLFWKHY